MSNLLRRYFLFIIQSYILKIELLLNISASSFVLFCAEYESENPRLLTNCGHDFHLACILEWMERSEACPVCDKVCVSEKTAIFFTYIFRFFRVT